jgi:hypothetical protein
MFSKVSLMIFYYYVAKFEPFNNVVSIISFLIDNNKYYNQPTYRTASTTIVSCIMPSTILSNGNANA